jgi:hypothetical protein
MPIGTLTDHVSAMLDALERVFVLYEKEKENENDSEGDAMSPLKTAAS